MREWSRRFWAPLDITLLRKVTLRIASVVGAAAIIGLMHDRSRWLVTAAAFALGFGVFWVWRKTRHVRKEWWSWLVYLVAIFGGLLLMASDAASRELGVSPPIAVFGGLGAALAGAAGLLSMIRYSEIVTERQRTAIAGEIAGIVLAFVTGTTAFVVLQRSRGDSALWSVLLLGAVALLYVSLSLLSESLYGHEEQVVASNDHGAATTHRRTASGRLYISGWVWPVVAAAVVIGVVAWLVLAANISFAVVAFIAIVLFALLYAIAADGAADMAAVLVVVSLAWSLAPRTESRRSEPLAAGQTVLVALGDSYISGEGATTFLDGTNDEDRNECRRAPSAYASLLVADGDDDHGGLADPTFDNLVFLGCSGAQAADLDAHVQYVNEPPDAPTRLRDNGVWRGGATQLEQLDEVLRSVRVREGDGDEDPERDLRGLVIVSLGGNDAGFGSIATACVGLGNCADVVDAWAADLAVVSSHLDRAYAALRELVGPRVPVLVVPYPIPLAPQRCDLSVMRQSEHTALTLFVQQLNTEIEHAATQHGFAVLDVQPAFEGHRICDTNDADDWYVNYIAAHPTGGSFASLSNPRNWFHNSLHPNAHGHEAIAREVKSWVAQNAEAIDASRFELPDDPFRLRYLPDEGARPSEALPSIGRGACVVHGADWATDWTACATGNVLKWFVLPAIVFLVAMWVLAFNVLHVWRWAIARRERPVAT
jgi:GDSL-like Lipase/Acylhydrolase family